MKVDYFIVTAFPEESAPIVERLSSPKPVTATGFWIGAAKSDEGVTHGILLYRPGCGQGTNRANTLTMQAILEHKPRVVLLVGIAGGFDEHDICLGDVLVPEHIDAYELAKKMPGEGVSKVEHRQPPFTVTATNLVKIARSIKYDDEDWYRGITEPRPNAKEREFPVIHAPDRGVLGSGDKNLADRAAEEREYLMNEHASRALGFDMEAAGVAGACTDQGVPFAVVKGVQDNGTLDKDNPQTKDQWRAYAADAAATVALLMIRKCPLDQVDRRRIVPRTVQKTNITVRSALGQIRSLGISALPGFATLSSMLEALQTQPVQLGKILLPIVVLQGGDGQLRYRYPGGIVVKPDHDTFQLPEDILSIEEALLRPFLESSRRGDTLVENRPMVRLNNWRPILERGGDTPGQLRLHIGLTDFFANLATNRSLIPWPGARLPSGETVRKYASDPYELRTSKLANPLATNLSVLTKDRKIVVSLRGRKEATSPGTFGPAVSGTGTPDDKDPNSTEYSPYVTAKREASQEVTGLVSFPIEDIVFFGLARTLHTFYPFLFGELRLGLHSAVLKSIIPQDKYENEGLTAVPFTVKSGDILDQGTIS